MLLASGTEVGQATDASQLCPKVHYPEIGWVKLRPLWPRMGSRFQSNILNFALASIVAAYASF